MVVSKDSSVIKTTKAPKKKALSDTSECCDTACMSSCATTSCCRNPHTVRWIVIILLLVANLASVWYAHSTNNSLEILKMWWQENYEKIYTMMQTDSYKQYATQGIDAMIMQQTQNTSTSNLMPEWDISWEENTDTVTPLLDDAEWRGDM